MNRLHGNILSLVVGFLPAITSIPATAEDAPVITNFKFGLICGPADNRRVCFQTNVIQVTNESSCAYNQKPIRCTWYGLSYDYSAASDIKINCEYQTDKITNLGNATEALKPSAKIQVEMTLKEGRHHFFLAQYIFGEKMDTSPKRAVESCSFAGKPLFSTAFRFEFTDSTAPAESVPDMNVRR